MRARTLQSCCWRWTSCSPVVRARMHTPCCLRPMPAGISTGEPSLPAGEGARLQEAFGGQEKLTGTAPCLHGPGMKEMVGGLEAA